MGFFFVVDVVIVVVVVVHFIKFVPVDFYFDEICRVIWNIVTDIYFLFNYVWKSTGFQNKKITLFNSCHPICYFIQKIPQDFIINNNYVSLLINSVIAFHMLYIKLSCVLNVIIDLFEWMFFVVQTLCFVINILLKLIPTKYFYWINVSLIFDMFLAI